MLSDWANLQLFFLKNPKKFRKCRKISPQVMIHLTQVKICASAGAARLRALRASRQCVLLYFLKF